MSGGNTPTLDLFSKNLRALRGERSFNAKVLRNGAVASLSGANYSAGSPS
jgi:hypothetical protein